MECLAEGTNLGRKMKNNNVDDVLWHGDGEDVMVCCVVCVMRWKEAKRRRQNNL